MEGSPSAVPTLVGAGRRPRAVLLDALGTLLDLEPPWPLLVDALRRAHGLEIGLDDARRAVRAEIAHYRRHNQRASDAESLARLRLECAEVVRSTLGAPVASLTARELEPALLQSLRFRPFPDVRPALERWRSAGVATAIVSNWDVSLYEVLEGCGLAGLLDAVVVSAVEGVVKPDRGLWEIALERLGVAGAEAVHIGDSYEHDVVGAHAAGVACVLLARPGAEGAQLQASRARADGVTVIAGLEEIVP